MSYIGISGITSRDQIDAIVEGYQSLRHLAVGVLASYKTLLMRAQNRYPMRYPRAVDIPAIWSEDRRVLNVLHYSISDVDCSRTPIDLANELRIVRAMAGEPVNRHGTPVPIWLQLNVKPRIEPWHAEVLTHVLTSTDRSWSAAIVQLSGELLADQTHARSVLNELERFSTHLLFDASGGRGVPLEPERVEWWIGYATWKGWSCGVAGGLGPDRLPARLLERYPDLSIDAETCLRDSSDKLVIEAARTYWARALKLYEAK